MNCLRTNPVTSHTDLTYASLDLTCCRVCIHYLSVGFKFISVILLFCFCYDIESVAPLFCWVIPLSYYLLSFCFDYIANWMFYHNSFSFCGAESAASHPCVNYTTCFHCSQNDTLLPLTHSTFVPILAVSTGKTDFSKSHLNTGQLGSSSTINHLQQNVIIGE